MEKDNMCISRGDMNPKLTPVLRFNLRNGQETICRGDTGLSPEEFIAFVSAIEQDIMITVQGKKILEPI